MKRIAFLLFVVLTLTGMAQSQTFTVEVGGISFNFTSDDGATATLVQGGYSGMVVVPDQVTYEGVDYEVTQLGRNCFNSTGLTYVSLPSTLNNMLFQSFGSCPNLDSVEFRGTVPPEHHDYAMNANIYKTVPVRVPCGSLQAYVRSFANATPSKDFENFFSSCSVLISASIDSADLGSIEGDGQYEIGDTTSIACVTGRVFLGWSNGSGENPLAMVVTGPETLVAHVVPVHKTGISAQLEANNIATAVYLFGGMGYDDGPTQFFWPAGSQSSTLYANGLWVGGMDHDSVLHLAASRFNHEGCDFRPGPLGPSGEAPSMEEAQHYRQVWSLTREEIDYHVAHVGEPDYTVCDAIAHWPIVTPDDFYDADSDGHYNPLAGDYPVIRGDQATASIFNDKTYHGESKGQPIGLEVRAMTYAFNEPNDPALHNTVFLHYDLTKRTAGDLYDAYIGFWTDGDLGYGLDDYVGCDVQRGAYYFYNGKEVDGPSTGCYEGVPPAMYCATLGSPAADNVYGNGMSNFLYYDISYSQVSGQPLDAQSYYHYMQGIWRNGSYLYFGGDGMTNGVDPGLIRAKYMFPGSSDPQHYGTGGVVPTVYPDNWTEATVGNSPADRRGISGMGPFTLVSGVTEQVDVAYTISASTTNAWGSVVRTGQLVDTVRTLFLNDTTLSGRPFAYRPYSAPHEVSIAQAETYQVRLYPNPASDYMRIEADGLAMQRVELYDMQGRQLRSFAPASSSQCALELHSLPTGTYIVRITSDNSIVHKKIIKK